ncbi:MAG: DUF7715 family protein [Acidimicrobiales bacterium]
MQLLLATSETQGEADGDYFWSTPGEIVQPPTFVCHAYPSSCGCDRAWAGLESRGACTTAVVAETDLTPHELRQAVHREGPLPRELIIRGPGAPAIRE